MKKLISKHFNNLDQAEAFHDKLYEKYNYVQLVNFPRFDPKGEGNYVWEVKD